MVYGYSTNKEFIDKSYRLLEKLEAKGLWNKDTLVIGLDKSVRPLAYTLRKLSSEEGRETPDIMFYNRAGFGNPKGISSKIKERIDTQKLNNYKKIIILDEHIKSGGALKETKEVFENYFSHVKKKPKIYISSLGLTEENTLSKNKLIYVDDFMSYDRAKNYETGIEDKENKDFWKDLNPIQESTPIKDKEVRKQFLANRYQLSKDIKNYLHEKHPEKVSEKNKSLEKIVSGIFIFSFLAGLFFSFGNLTGNVIGNSLDGQKLFGIVLVLVGIGGFFVYQKFRE